MAVRVESRTQQRRAVRHRHRQGDTHLRRGTRHRWVQAASLRHRSVRNLSRSRQPGFRHDPGCAARCRQRTAETLGSPRVRAVAGVHEVSAAVRAAEMIDGISRRTMLRAAGAALALPWLESVPVLAASTQARACPKRFAVLFMGNGVSGNHWWARGNGADMTLSRSLEPLEPLKLKINVING